MIIYKITNLINKKIYIGQTTQTIDKRWQNHCSRSMCNRSMLSRAIQKYGKENFTIEVIFHASDLKELNDKEKELIGLYLSNDRQYGYNIREGGNNTPLSERTKQKISIALSGKALSVLHKKAISNNWNRKSIEHFKKNVLCVNTNQMFTSVSEASIKMNIPRRTLCRILKMNKPSKNGYVFKYIGKGE